MLMKIVTNTPIWVWGLLLALVLLGIGETRARCVRLKRILILPSVMTGLSLSGMVLSFGFTPAVLMAWLVTSGFILRLIVRRPVPALTQYDHDTGIFYLPASWVPMALILGIFVIKYIVNATLAIYPELAKSTEFSTAVSALYGASSGVFIARAVRLWKMSD